MTRSLLSTIFLCIVEPGNQAFRYRIVESFGDYEARMTDKATVLNRGRSFFSVLSRRLLAQGSSIGEVLLTPSSVS